MGAFNGSGLFVRSYNWVTDKINGVNITASRVDTEDDGFAAGLSNCVTRDGQGKMGAAFTPASSTVYDLGAPSAQWRNAYLSGDLTAANILDTNNRLLKTSAQTITANATPFADSKLVVVPVSVGSYLLEARMAFTADATSAAGGLKVGIFGTFLNANSALITYIGRINGAFVSGGPSAITAVNSAAFNFATLANAGAGANWVILTGTINIANVTGSPLLGVNWSQNTSTGGNLTAETGCYLQLSRVT